MDDICAFLMFGSKTGKKKKNSLKKMNKSQNLRELL